VDEIVFGGAIKDGGRPLINHRINKIKIIGEIAKRYNISPNGINIDYGYSYAPHNFNYLYDGVNNVNEKVQGRVDYREPIYWFVLDNKKYVMKEQVEYCIHTFTEKLLVDYCNEPNSDFVYDTNSYLERLYYFYRNEVNLFGDVFPKLLDETDEFFIFEMIDGDPVSEINSNIASQYFEKVSKVVAHTKNFRPKNNVANNWVLTPSGVIKYVSIRHFVLIDNPEIVMMDYHECIIDDKGNRTGMIENYYEHAEGGGKK
jgi:hypothetical protein